VVLFCLSHRIVFPSHRIDTATMSAPSPLPKRAIHSSSRTSDIGTMRESVVNDDKSRRKTMDGPGPASSTGTGASTGSSSTLAPPTLTPSKQRYNLPVGPAANFYFGYINSAVKRKKEKLHDDGMEEVAGLGDTSMLSIGGNSSSSEEMDLLNKSTLSDTTELTASNFILTATSKQIFGQIPSFRKAEKSENQQKVSATSQAKKDAEEEEAKVPRKPLTNLDANDTQASPDRRRRSVIGASPSMRSRVSASPSSLRKFTENLKASRLKRQATREDESKKRLSMESDSSTLFAPPATFEVTEAVLPDRKRLPPPFTQVGSNSSGPSRSNGESSEESDVSAGAMDDLLHDFLDDNNDSGEGSSLNKLSTNRPLGSSINSEDACTKSLKSAIDAQGSPALSMAKHRLGSHPKNITAGTPRPIPDSIEFDADAESILASDGKHESIPTTTPPSSPVSTRGSATSKFRLTSNSHSKLTPTKLVKSPRRINNPRPVDSPARNTRSATVKSPTTRGNKDEYNTEGVMEVASDANNVPLGHDMEIDGDSTASIVFGVSGVLDKSGIDESVSRGGHSTHTKEGSASKQTASTMKDTDNSFFSRAYPKASPTSMNEAGDEDETADLADFDEFIGISGAEPVKLTPNKPVNERSPFRMTPNSHVKPTPTNLEPSPRRVPNPKTFDSPARNTRRARSALERESTGDTISVGLLDDLLGDSSDNKRKREEDETVTTAAFGEVFDMEGAFASEESSSLKRPRRSSILPFSTSSEKSPLTKPKPRGILSSRKKRYGDSLGTKQSHRSVAFGSPEAAEYHIGSPSVSLTPMPPSRAKAMFAIPRDQTDDEAALPGGITDSQVAEETVEIEADLNTLVDNMKGSPGLSPIANVNDREDNTGSFNISSSIYNLSMTSATSGASLAPSSHVSSKTNSDDGETTVELEPKIENVIAYAADDTTGSARFESDVPISMISMESIVKPSSAKVMGDSMSLIDTDLGKGEEPETTVELEPNFSALLNKALGAADPAASEESTASRAKHAESISPSESIDLTDAQSIASMNSRSEKFTADISCPMGGQKLDFDMQPCDSSLRDDNLGDSAHPEGDHTIELEMNMSDLYDTMVTLRETDAVVPSGHGMAGLLVAAGTGEIDYQADEDNTLGEFDNADKRLIVDRVPEGRDGSSNGESKEKLAVELAESPVNSVGRSRRSSLMSRRFSLAPAGRLSLSSNGEILLDSADTNASAPVETPRESIGAGGESDAAKLNKEPEKPTNEPIDITSAEIAEAAGANSVDPFSALGPKASDVLVRFSSSARELNNAIVSESLSQFVTAVCGEVESRTETESDLVISLTSIIEKKPDQLLGFQRVLRSNQNEPAKQDFQRLSDMVKRSVTSDWYSWSSLVLETLLTQLPTEKVLMDLKGDMSILGAASKLSNDTREQLSMIANQTIQRARKRSLARRNVSLCYFYPRRIDESF
jgi:hypothetical protein